MNQKLIIGIVVIIIAAGGFGIYSSNNSKTETMEKDTMMKKDIATTTPKMDAMMSVGSYEVYSSEKIALASATHDIVLFFRASWCPTCKAIDEDIKAHLKDIPASLTILDVNYDNSTDLKKKYGVTYQHTFVQVDAQGNIIKKWSGGSTLTSLISKIK